MGTKDLNLGMAATSGDMNDSFSITWHPMPRISSTVHEISKLTIEDAHNDKQNNLCHEDKALCFFDSKL